MSVARLFRSVLFLFFFSDLESGGRDSGITICQLKDKYPIPLRPTLAFRHFALPAARVWFYRSTVRSWSESCKKIYNLENKWMAGPFFSDSPATCKTCKNRKLFCQVTDQYIHRLLHPCLRSHYHLHQKKRKCWEKCSKSYVFGRPKPKQHEKLNSKVRTRLHCFPLSKTVTPSQASDQEVCQSNIEIEGMHSSPPLPLSRTVTPSQALDREASQSNIKTQPAQFVNPERQKIRAENLRIRTGRFRILIIGRANAGKTTIL